MYKVWRIEGPGGVGPYRNYRLPNVIKHFGINSHLDHEHPGFWEDLPDIIDYALDYHEYYCGFPHRTLLRKWFWGLQTFLIFVGYHVVEYEVKGYILGRSKKQCFFRRKDVITKTIIK